jgi:hypothetical protein
MLPDDKSAAPECGPDLLGTGVGVRSGPCSLGDESGPNYSTLQTPKYEVRERLSAQPRELGCEVRR